MKYSVSDFALAHVENLASSVENYFSISHKKLSFFSQLPIIQANEGEKNKHI
jgi:hypothetical protein